jgi:radical SAM protein with 4Fe4S-binding SPASM domain
MNKEKLLNSKTFCMLPWIHMHIWPAGTTYPCCMAHPDGALGSTKHQTLKEIWNGEPMKKLRLDMINDNTNLMCRRCYELELE